MKILRDLKGEDLPDLADKKTEEALEKANFLGDLILPVKVNPDLPIKLLF